ncbi:MAG: hypothetical protein ABIG95_05540 [Candidatus Woesearchaeota archaeon]
MYVIPKLNGKSFKQLGTCRMCHKKYTVDKESDVYISKYAAKWYCKDCYQKHFHEEVDVQV